MDKFVSLKTLFSFILGLIGSGIAYFLGGFTAAIQVLLIFMALDFLTGLMVAGIFKKSGKSENGALDSRVGWRGLAKKVYTIVLVGVAAQVDRLVGTNSFARDATTLSFIVNEALSIVENAGLMGIPLPSKLKDALELLKSKSENQSINNENDVAE